jgi:predicted esterase
MEMKTYEFLVSLPVNEGGQVVTHEQGRNPVEAQKIVESRFPNATFCDVQGSRHRMELMTQEKKRQIRELMRQKISLEDQIQFESDQRRIQRLEDDLFEVCHSSGQTHQWCVV